ncbi:Hypothetical predicted protein [Scomber scombrus]|uniref:Uncharacterized protein n=1 Tax=Scomber scombrus TaxID=13677 RepID=A0AAV1PCD0_SCOSC
MAGEDGRRCTSRQTVAVILLLCSLVPSLDCFRWQGLVKKAKQNRVVGEAIVMDERTGSILFNGKELNSQPVSPFVAATENEEVLHVDLAQSDGTGLSEQASQLANDMAHEAAWKHLNPALHCGQSKMKFKAMGPGAAALQLDMGNARPLPLIQVPEPCGYSIRQNALGLALVVPYDGCYVIQENGNYVLPMSWRETPVTFTCPMSPNPETPTTTTPTTTTPTTTIANAAQQPSYIYDPSSLYPPPWYYLYNMDMMTPAPTTDTASPTTTAKPDVTTKNAEKPPPMKLPAHYHYPYYPYHHHYPLPNLPVMTTTTPKPTTGAQIPQEPQKPHYQLYYPFNTGPHLPVMTTTTPKPTTGAKIPQEPQKPHYQLYYPFNTGPHLPVMTTTTPKPTTGAKIPQEPQKPHYQLYYPFNTGPQFPGFPYNQVIQDLYGKPPQPQEPQQPVQTIQLPAPTTTTAKPSPTTKPTTVSTPSTSSTTVSTTKACSSTTKPSSSFTGPTITYFPYSDLPFAAYTSNRARKIPDQYMPETGYKSGLQAQAHPHLGMHYWPPFAQVSTLNR